MAERAPGGRSVVSLVRRLQVVALLGVLVLGLLGVLAALSSLRTTAQLTGEILPAVSANEQVLQDLTDAETGVRAYSLTGDPATLAPYRGGVGAYPGHAEVLREYAAGDAALAELVARLEEAAEQWLRDYADVKLAGPGGPTAFDAALFTVGRERFEAVRAAHAATTAALDRDVVAAERAARTRLVALALLAAGVLVVLLLAAVLASRRLDRDVVAPLAGLERTVGRLADGDHEARAHPSGSREVAAVAVALNGLAAAQSRARAVEEQVRDELRRLDSARTDFVSNVSHELRTPLTTITGVVELAAEEFAGRMSPRHERMIEAVSRNADRLRALVDDILTLSRAEASSTSLEQVALRDVVDDCVADLRMTAARRGIEVRLEAAADDPLLVLADRGQVSRALLNVLGNAVKFSPDGTVVEVHAGRGADVVEVRVADRGIGIPAGELAQLGSRFFRASNAVAGSVQGTGLGLRIVQTILDHHAGTLQVESVEGEGTTVTVRLPAQADARAGAPGRAAVEAR